MEKEDYFLHKVSDVLAILATHHHCPVVREALWSRLLPPRGRVAEHKLDLDRLAEKRVRSESQVITLTHGLLYVEWCSLVPSHYQMTLLRPMLMSISVILPSLIPRPKRAGNETSSIMTFI